MIAARHGSLDRSRVVPAPARPSVEREVVTPPVVLTPQAAVDPASPLLVPRTEVQQDPLPAPVPRHVEAPAIPQPVVGRERLADPGQCRLERERDEDLPRELRGERLGAPGDGVIPQPVQGLPALPHELRPRVFPPGVVRRDLLPPLGHEAWPGRLPVVIPRRDAGRDRAAGYALPRRDGGVPACTALKPARGG